MSRLARSLLFTLELGLGLFYVAAFAFFVTQSRDFIVAMDNSRAEELASSIQADARGRFEFGKTASDNGLLGVGWWRFDEQSADGVWSKDRAYAYVPVPTDAESLDLVIEGEPFLAPGHESVEIVLKVDGTEAGRWTPALGQQPTDLVVAVPADASADGVVELRFDIDFPVVGYHYGYLDEKREIGFELRSVTLEPH